jgi:beta-glucanase (GH16 family)
VIMQPHEIEGHADSLLPSGKKWKLAWHDEFDGVVLDETKWSFRRNFWGKPFPAFTDQGVVLDGKSHLQLHLLEKDGEYCSPHLQTGSLTYDIPKDSEGFWPFGKRQAPKFMHRFGYYEIRCRMNKCDGWHAAFWLQSPSIGAAPDPRYCGVECDIMENYKLFQENILLCGNIWGGYGKDHQSHGHFRVPFKETPDGWHHYGVDWSRNGYVFYADGQKVGEVGGPVSQVEQFILVSTECHGYRGPGFTAPGKHPIGVPCELLKKAVLPDYFEVDFVRVYDEIA